jgi:hypothetical protein
VGSVDEVLGERFEWRGGIAEGFQRSEGVGDELGSIVLGLRNAEDGGPGRFDGRSVLAGGLAELLGGLRDVEDVVDDLEREAGFFAEGAQACDGVEVCVRGGRTQPEQPAADDAGVDERTGLGAVDALYELGCGGDAFGFDINDLAADHAGDDARVAADASADGQRKLAQDLDDRGRRSGKLGESLEGERL